MLNRLAKFAVAAAVLALLLLVPFAAAAPTSSGVCSTGCGSSALCDGKRTGESCAIGYCDSSCQCVNDCNTADPDTSKKCCEGQGFKWAKGGESGPFGQFTIADIITQRAECVGDDAGEYYRFRECEGAACSTDAKDEAGCASPNSCVYQGKCYSRLDKIVEEQTAVKALIEANKNKDDEKGRLLKKLEELTLKAKTAKSNRERREFSKEIAAVMKKIAKQKDDSGKELDEAIGKQGQGIAVTNAQSGAVATCIAR